MIKQTQRTTRNINNQKKEAQKNPHTHKKTKTNGIADAHLPHPFFFSRFAKNTLPCLQQKEERVRE